MTDRIPRVSVVLPTYNRAHTLLRAITSVLSQDYREIELIVVDDGSTDDTASLLGGIADPRLRLIRHEQNRGVAAATNTGIRAARGNLIAFQDSDDEWLYGKLSRQMAAFSAAGENCVGVYCVKIVYGRDPDFSRGIRRIACVPGPGETVVQGDLREVLWRRNLVSPQTALCAREAALRLGGFDEKLRTDQDWDFFTRLCEMGTLAFVDTPLVNTYLQPDSISTDSRRSHYSQFVITNKMKRRGVPRTVLAEHWSRLGFSFAKRTGNKQRGLVVLCAALKERPVHAKTLYRYLMTRLFR